MALPPRHFVPPWHGLPRGWLLLGQVLIACTLLLFLWHVADGRQAAARLAATEPLWLLAAWIALNIQTVLSALRWRLTAASLGMDLPAKKAIREYYMSQIVNQTVPGGVVGDATRAVRNRHGADLERSAQSVMIERLIGQIAICILLLISLPLAIALPGGIAWPLDGMAGALGISLALVLVVTTIWIALRNRVALVARFGVALRLVAQDKARRWRQFMLAIAILACNLGAFAFAARATGTALSLEAIVTIVPLILFSMLVPLTIAGWGVREGAAAALFPLAGASAAAGLAAGVTFGLLILAAALPGAFWLLPAKSAARKYHK